MNILGITFGKKNNINPIQNEIQENTEKKNPEKLFIKNEIESKKPLFEYLKKELFDNIANKDGNFIGNYEIKTRSNNVIFKASCTSNNSIVYEFYDKANRQSIIFEDLNGDGNINSAIIHNSDGSIISAFDKDFDGYFDIYNIKDKNSERSYNDEN